MAPDYPGPQALKGSKHAAEWAKSPTLTRANPMSTLTMNTKPLKADDESSNADVDLAIAQDKHLKEAMITHSSSFAKAVSAAVTNTHRLLGLLRQSVKSGDSDTRKKHLEELWDELERLFKASKEAQAAFPQLLEKQNENARLYHGAMAHAAMKETQSELAQQHKKVEIQHSLILDHQQAFMDYQETIKGKLEELAKAKAQITTLQERVSRLTLDKGLYKSEFDKYKRTMDELKAGVSAEAARKLEDELKLSQAAAKKACDEYETLDRAKNDMQNAFEARIADLSDKQGVSRKELEQQRAEYATLQAKFQNQSNEYSGKFAVSHLPTCPPQGFINQHNRSPRS